MSNLGINRTAWLVVQPDVAWAVFPPTSIQVMPARHCLDNAAELVPYLRPGTRLRLVEQEGQVFGANKEGWVFTCT